MHRTRKEQLLHFLSDMYSVEQQALAQMVSAPKIAQDPSLAADFEQHYAETEQQANVVRKRLETLGGSPSAVKNAVMKLGGKAFLLFARVMPETPGRLVVHSYSYEAMEWAGYEMLARFAEQAGDAETVDAAKAIGKQEREMMKRLESHFDAAEAVSHTSLTSERLADHVRKHLTEVHAFERQNIELLKKSEEIAGSERLAAGYARQLESIREHARSVEARLDALGSDSSKLKDGALAAGGLNWAFFFQAQSDTPAKLAAFVYAVLHLQIGGYELLWRTAARAGDTETRDLCKRLVVEKRALAENLSNTFDAAVVATLDDVTSSA
jgi:ferritin-like metal-binding protein YciE